MVRANTPLLYGEVDAEVLDFKEEGLLGVFTSVTEQRGVVHEWEMFQAFQNGQRTQRPVSDFHQLRHLHRTLWLSLGTAWCKTAAGRPTPILALSGDRGQTVDHLADFGDTPHRARGCTDVAAGAAVR